MKTPSHGEVIRTDNLTHGLLGLAIAALKRPELPPDPRTGRSMRTDTDRAVLWGSLLAAEAPDVDVFFRPLGLVGGIWNHRSITHTLVGGPLVALAAALVAKAIWRRARFGTLYPYCLAATMIAHIAFDWVTSYGVRALMPWSFETYTADALFIIEPIVTLPLLLAAIFGRYRPQLRRAALLTAGAFVMLYTLGKGLASFDLNRALRAEIAAAHANVLRTAVQPGLFGVLPWQYIVELPDRYEVGEVSYPFRRFNREELLKMDGPAVAAARAHPLVREALAFYRYPLTRVESEADGYRVVFSDLRFRFRGTNRFSATVWLDPDYRVRRVELMPG